MRNSSDMVVLLTGFGAFPGARTNPTMAIVAALGRSRRFALRGVRIEAAILPVVYAATEREAARLIEQASPDIVVELGLAARRRHVSVETRAVNRVSPLRPDAARRFSPATTVVAGGPAFRRSRWSAPALVAAMRPAAPTRVSIDAGDYLCNQFLYLSLGMTPVPAGFIHVPRPRGRIPGRRVKWPRPSLLAVTRSVEAAILALCAGARRRAP